MFLIQDKYQNIRIVCILNLIYHLNYKINTCKYEMKRIVCVEVFSLEELKMKSKHPLLYKILLNFQDYTTNTPYSNSVSWIIYH